MPGGLRSGLTSLLGAALLAACSGGGATTPDASDRGLARVRVVVEANASDPHVALEAAFLRYHALSPADAALIAGAPRWATPVPGRCVTEDDDASLDRVLEAASPEADVALLDAGELVVDTDVGGLRVAPRYLPELLPFVAGVTYASRAPAGFAGSGGEITLGGTGGGELARFEVSAALPASPVPVIDGEAAPPVVELAGPPARLEVGWLGEGPGMLSIVVEGAGRRTRCWPAAAGAFALPREALALLTDGGTLAIERAIRVRMDLADLGPGALEVVSRESVPVRVW